MACKLRKFRKVTRYPHKRSEGLRKSRALSQRGVPAVSATGVRRLRSGTGRCLRRSRAAALRLLRTAPVTRAARRDGAA